MDLTPDQIQKLNSLGIKVNDKEKLTEEIPQEQVNLSTNITTSSPTNNIKPDSVTIHPVIQSSSHPVHHSNIFPLLSISGLTILSFSGLILFKNKAQETPSNSNTNYTLPETSVSPTQVPKSIQHYLLTSQQYFTSASTKSADEGGSSQQAIDDLNQSILAATNAIKEFPTDYRGFYQRGRIYQSVLASKPELISQVLSDLSQAQKLDPSNPEITRSLASAYAQKGDAQNTINYLSQTVALEPTKAQNFYDLAKIQQQVGLLPQALETYSKLLTLVSDPNQKTQVESEKSSIEKLISQNINHSEAPVKDGSNNFISPSPTVNLPSSLDGPTIQASTSTGLIVAAPEEIDSVQVSNLTTSNSLSGKNILTAGSKETSISNSQVKSASQVYVSTIRGGKNQNLQVTSKTDGSFTVGLDSPISEDIEFNWWIIN